MLEPGLTSLLIPGFCGPDNLQCTSLPGDFLRGHLSVGARQRAGITPRHDLSKIAPETSQSFFAFTRQRMPKLKEGVLIVFEGIDGAGKSTQAKLLCKRLNQAGYETVFSKEPTNGTWGKKIQTVIKEGRRAVTAEQELEWFIKDRQEHVTGTILPALKARKIVVLDRYYFSTIAYQGALGLDPQEIEQRNKGFAPPPDLLFLVDISPQEGLRRIAKAREGGADFFEREHYLERVCQGFAQLGGPFLHRLSGDKSVAVLADEAWNITSNALKKKEIFKDN